MSKRQVNESIADKPSINFQIERQLKKHDPETQTRILDALEAVKNAGEQGIAVADWANHIRTLYPDSDFSIGDLLKTVVANFKCCVDRVGDKRYGWHEEDRDGGADVPQGVQQSIDSQMRVTKIAMNAMKQLGEFTAVELASEIASKTGMPISSAIGFAQHIIKQFIGGTLATIGNDRYKVKSEKPKTADDQVNALKDLLRKSGLGPRD